MDKQCEIVLQLIKILEKEYDKCQCLATLKTLHTLLNNPSNSPYYLILKKYKSFMKEIEDLNFRNDEIRFICERLIREGELTTYFRQGNNKLVFTTKDIAYEDRLFYGNSSSKKYSLEHLLSMADWDYHAPIGGKVVYYYKCKDGFIFECHSKGEYKLVKQLDSNPYFLNIRGQNFQICYETEDGITHQYSPDFVVLTRKGQIALIERKDKFLMADNEALFKYYIMSLFAEENGYLYEMWDSNKRTFRSLRNKNVSWKIKHSFEKNISEYGWYVFDDFAEETEGMTMKERNKYKESLAALSIQGGYWWDEDHFGGHKFAIMPPDDEHNNYAIHHFKTE